MNKRFSAARYLIRDCAGYSYGILVATTEVLARDFIRRTLGPRTDYSFERRGYMIVQHKEFAQWEDVINPALPDIIEPPYLPSMVTEIIWSRKQLTKLSKGSTT